MEHLRFTYSLKNYFGFMVTVWDNVHTRIDRTMPLQYPMSYGAINTNPCKIGSVAITVMLTFLSLLLKRTSC